MGIVKHIPKKPDISKMTLKKAYVKMTEEQKLDKIKKRLTCECCNIVHKNKYYLDRHLSTDPIIIKNRNKKANKTVNLTCLCCGILWTNTPMLTRHLQSKARTNQKRAVRKDKCIYKCSLCGCFKINNFHLNRHLKYCNRKHNIQQTNNINLSTDDI